MRKAPHSEGLSFILRLYVPCGRFLARFFGAAACFFPQWLKYAETFTDHIIATIYRIFPETIDIKHKIWYNRIVERRSFLLTNDSICDLF